MSEYMSDTTDQTEKNETAPAPAPAAMVRTTSPRPGKSKKSSSMISDRSKRSSSPNSFDVKGSRTTSVRYPSPSRVIARRKSLNLSECLSNPNLDDKFNLTSLDLSPTRKQNKGEIPEDFLIYGESRTD